MCFVEDKSERNTLYATPLQNIKRKSVWEELNAWTYSPGLDAPMGESVLLTTRGKVGVVPPFNNVHSVNVEYCRDPINAFQHYRDIKMVTTGKYAGCDAASLVAAFPQMTHFSSKSGQLIKDVLAATSNIQVVRFLHVDLDVSTVESYPNVKFYALLDSREHSDFIENSMSKRCDNLHVALKINSSRSFDYKPTKFNIDHIFINFDNDTNRTYYVPKVFRNIRKLNVTVHHLGIVPNIKIIDFPNLECINLKVREGDYANFDILCVPFLRKLFATPNANVDCDPRSVRIYNPW
jgi:hypothetical protein